MQQRAGSHTVTTSAPARLQAARTQHAKRDKEMSNRAQVDFTFHFNESAMCSVLVLRPLKELVKTVFM
jgi:hypothetical protein